MSEGKILVIDDEPQIRRVMRVLLTGHGYEVDDARTGEEALDKLWKHRFDLVLLDMAMPGAGGLETCRAMRAESQVGIIMLSVRDGNADKVQALDAGADDYVTKPFKSLELLARIRATLRRRPWTRDVAGQTTLGDTVIDFDARRASVAGRSNRLTPREFDVLRYLMAQSNKVVSHRELLQAVWGPGHGDDVEALRAVIHQLRQKIEPRPGEPSYLLTDSWVGYRLCVPSLAAAARPSTSSS